ncbi:hypothetical protein [Clostridium pasteurianum]|uniref:Uncharacterized protein n=1 Tax=Clostridium pasteurianum BC1 TaxID=86416 RepID=R4K501_CLOPA|nr:hypothetical protein [Clostridium pasteurianum]AGK95604.1 hypothetical protein Clopa_0556 [Clostridium pasteurianum BC1]
MTRKYDVGEIMTLEEAVIFQNEGVAIVVTDGKFVEVYVEE